MSNISFSSIILTSLFFQKQSKKRVLRNYIKFTGKHLCRVPTLIELQTSSLQFCKKETLTHVFPCEFCKISKNTFSHRTPPVAASYFYHPYNFHKIITFCKISNYKSYHEHDLTFTHILSFLGSFLAISTSIFQHQDRHWRQHRH